VFPGEREFNLVVNVIEDDRSGVSKVCDDT
jgi:hypothetical protein